MARQSAQFKHENTKVLLAMREHIEHKTYRFQNNAEN